MLLKPNIPILRLFSEDERAVRLYGPPQLKVLCAEALNRKLLASLEQLSTNPPPKPKLPLAVPAPAATLAQPPQPHSSAQQTLLPRPSMHARHPSASLPTVPEADDEMTTTTNMSRDTPVNPSFTGEHGPDSGGGARSPPSTLSAQSNTQSQSNTPQPSSPSRVGVNLQDDTFPGVARGGSQEELQAIFVPPNAAQQQQQQKQANLDGTSPVHSLVQNAMEAPSLDLWQYPDQPRSSGTMPNPGPSPFAAMAAAPPSRASLEATSQQPGTSPPHAHTISTVSSGGGGVVGPPEPGAVLSSAAAAAAAAAHVDPKAAGAPPPITTSRLPGQATSSCEQHVHDGAMPMMDGADSSSLLLPTPPRSQSSSPVPVLRSSGGGAVLQPLPSPTSNAHGSAAAKASLPASAAAVASSLLHSPNPVHKGDASATAYASLLDGNTSTGNPPVPTANHTSSAGAPVPPSLNPPNNFNITRPRPPVTHPVPEDRLSHTDSPAPTSDPHVFDLGGCGQYLQQHPSRNSLPKATPFSAQGWPGGSSTITSAPEYQRHSSYQSPNMSVPRLETATSNPIPGAGPSLSPGADTASQLYRSVSTATNGDNTAPNSPPRSAGVAGNATSTARASSTITGLFRTSSPLRNTPPFPKLRRRNSPPARTGGGTDSGAGPSTSQAAGSGSLRGGLRGLLHPQEKSTRSTDKSARSTDKSARGRTSLSGGLRRKRSGPLDPLASDMLSNPDDNPDNDEAHDALNVECGIHNEGVTDRLSYNGGVFGPRVFMSTKGSTVTLSHTPSMPIVDREVQEAAAAAVANSGQLSSPQLHSTETGVTPHTSSSNAFLPCTSAEGMGKKFMSTPALASLALVPYYEEHPLMIASPLYSQLSNDGSVGMVSPTSTTILNRLPRQDGASNNLLYSRGSTSTGLGLPGEASKASSASQLVDVAAAMNAPVDAQGGGALNVLTSAGVEVNSGPGSPLHSAGARGQAGSQQNSGTLGVAKSGTLLVQRSFGHAHSSHSGAEVLSAAELPTLDGQPIVTEAAGPAGVSNPDAFRQSSAGPAALDAASELCKPVDVLPAEAALYQVEEVEEECGVCMESMASLRLLPCTHTICGPCAHRMCSMFIQRAPHCPFCRSIIADVTAFYMPFVAPKAAALIPA